MFRQNHYHGKNPTTLVNLTNRRRHEGEAVWIGWNKNRKAVLPLLLQLLRTFWTPEVVKEESLFPEEHRLNLLILQVDVDFTAEVERSYEFLMVKYCFIVKSVQSQSELFGESR
jgi:hypothetical protein